MTRAPGRLDVMGGIADYSGSLVLQVASIYPEFFQIFIYLFFCFDLQRFSLLHLSYCFN